MIFGFEKMSAITERHQTLAAINGMFFTNNGFHAGGLIQNGKVITLPVPTTPMVIFSKDGETKIEDITSKAILRIRNQNMFEVSGINRFPYGNEVLFFDTNYGKTTRISTNATNYVVKNGKVVEIIEQSSPIEIPFDAQIIVDIGDNLVNFQIQVGDEVSLEISEPSLKTVYEGFQSGGWLLKDGQNVAKKYEPFVGGTMNMQPRSVFAIRNDGRIQLTAVDGRQPGFATGLTGFHTAELMKWFDCKDAVYLDGGSSTQLMIEDNIINQPSLKNGEQRSISHVLTIEKK